jgi:hypothetical protein
MGKVMFVAAIFSTLTAAADPIAVQGEDVDGRPVRLSDARGRVVAVTFASRYTGGEAERVNNALVSEVGDKLRMVSVIDFVGIPPMFFGMAKGIIARWTKRTPASLVVDEGSAWRRPLGADPARRVDIFVLDQSGEVRGHFVGADQVEDARRLIRALTGPETRAVAAR